jgi:cytochrome bd-type quinol oxidase subunit 2
MYATLLTAHSLVRWLLLILLLYAIYKGYAGYIKNKSFSKTDNAIRHWTATTGHIQLMIGMILYLKSPVVRSYWKYRSDQSLPYDFTFFSLIHIALMFAAIIVLTVGSAMAKRQGTDRQKFRTMLVWFIFALVIILIAIPWPFSPLAKRPLIRF